MHNAKAKQFLEAQPGHYIRRLQQIAVAVFLDETEAFGITPVQFAALSAIDDQPGLDQRGVARAIGFDAATLGGVVDRLQQRGLVERRASDADRRVWHLHATPDGRALVQDMRPAVQAAQRRILAPLPAAERPEFLRMLRQLVDVNNGLSRAPRGEGRGAAEMARGATLAVVGSRAARPAGGTTATTAAPPSASTRPPRPRKAP